MMKAEILIIIRDYWFINKKDSKEEEEGVDSEGLVRNNNNHWTWSSFLVPVSEWKEKNSEEGKSLDWKNIKLSSGKILCFNKSIYSPLPPSQWNDTVWPQREWFIVKKDISKRFSILGYSIFINFVKVNMNFH